MRADARRGACMDTERGPEARKAERFFRRIEASGVLSEGMRAEDAASAVFSALSRHLTREQMADLLSSLPGELLDELSVDAMHPEREAHPFGRQTFLSLVAERLGSGVDRAELVARAVFGALRHELDSNERHHAESQLPLDLRDLWHGFDSLPGSGGGPDLSPP